MHDKLKDLLVKIKLDEKYYPFFNGGTLKLVVNTKQKSWTININIDTILPANVYQLMIDSIRKTFADLPDVKEIRLKINANQIDYNLMATYWLYTLSQLTNDAPSITTLENNNLTIDNNQLTIDVINKIEQNKILKVKDKIETLYSLYGFKDVNINTKIDENQRNEIKQAINEDLKVNPIVVESKDKVNKNIIYGNLIKGKPYKISDILNEENDIIIEGYLFGVDYFESSKNNFKIITLKITDYTDSIYVKVFTRDTTEYEDLKTKLHAGDWLKIRGYTKNDIYSKDLVLNARDINKIEPKDEIIADAPEKRVELHAHTHMSQMDSVVGVKDLIKRAKKWGHKAVAITDHNSLQAFPEAYSEAKGIKVIYGVELTLIDDSIDIIFRPDDSKLKDNTYVVFDFETTGFNAGGGDTIIEIGAVKLHDGEIVDKFSELINLSRELPEKITEITGITNKMLKDKPTEVEVVKRFMEWVGDLPMVAHNAKFDASFLEMAYQKYNLGEFKNPLIDTLELSRTLDPSWGRHSLSHLVKRYDIPFDESSHHRGVYDAQATAMIFHQMIKKLTNRNINTLNEIDNLVPKEDIHKVGTGYHVILLAKNNVGLKNLFKLVSLANTKYLYKTPRILRSEIINHREGLLVGSSGCGDGEVFVLARSKSDEELANVINFYDYVEVLPISSYNHLIQMSDFANEAELKEHLQKIIRVSIDSGKLVVATGDVHLLDAKDKIYREIIINQKVPGGGRHPLARTNITNIPSAHLRTTNEMLAEFNFLDEELAKDIVIRNPNLIADMIEEVEVIKKQLYTPKMENAEQIIKDLVYKAAKEKYGDPLPTIIEERLEKELTGIISGGYDVIYLIAEKLVKKSNEDGYIVGSRGSVGSSLVATMLGITEVNPLPAHYICPKCKTTIFEIDGKPLGASYSSGYDLPDKKCDCGQMFNKEGQDMPFATFLGFKADKVPDIDLNFSGDYQAKAHDYTKELFGEQNVYRAGTIGTVAYKTAYGFVRGYMEEKNLHFRQAEIERLANGCVGVKRTTGQHPGGIIVIPDYMDIFDFSPYQYPADEINARWYTTHFDFHAIHDNVLKLDILGHDDPTVLKLLQDLTGVDILTIPFDDKKVLSIFSSPDALGVTKEDIMCETGTLGIPEFGTRFVIKMLEETKPKTFAELVKISGLSHGTAVWTGNAQELIQKKICDFKDVIGCRDDIMVYLSYNGLDPQDAFKIMEFVRKGKPTSDPEGWKPFEELMREKKIVDWYIESCRKIQYMFPKAHATAYVMMGVRIAWFKVHMPIYYYASYFSVRSFDFEIDTMIKGYDAIRDRVIELTNKGFDASQKETAVLDTLMIALEMWARGFKFGNIDLYKSDARYFIVDEDKKTLIPPFRTIEGLGDTVANNIVEERKKGNFISIEDLQKRSKLSTTLIDRMRIMGILKDLPESSQLSLF
ncbi:MAG: PolC-type DNA polymerase III [Bacilli bacterium]